MKHKILHTVLTALAAGVLLFSCKVDDIVPGGGRGDGLLSDKEMQFSLDFSFGGSGMSRVGDEEDPNATSDEKHISCVRVVLYEGTQITVNGVEQPDPAAKVLYAFDYYIQSLYDYTGYMEWEGFWPTGLEYGQGKHLFQSVNRNRFITYARPVEDRNYYMLVILNSFMPPFPAPFRPAETRGDEDPLASRMRELTEPGHTWSEFTQPVPMDAMTMYDPQMGGPAASRYFMMTNANGLVYVPNTSLGTSEATAHADPIEVEVERAVAKVTVTADDVDTSPGVEIGTISWDLVNTNKYFYWMRKQTHLITPTGGLGAFEKRGIPQDDRSVVYAEDPNFSGFSTSAGGTISARKEQFNTIEEIYEGKSPMELAFPTDAVEYTLENTMDAADQAPEVTTQTVIALPYKPNNAAYSFSDAQQKRLNQGYFIFNDILITFAEMESYAAAPGTIPSPSLDGLADAITAVTNDPGLLLDLTAIAESDAIEPFDEYGLKYYRYGINYYSVLIKHYNADPMDAYGRYGIVRNNYYKVNITEVSGPGSPVLHRPVYISAEVDIMEWLVSKQDEDDLGEEIEDINKDAIVTYRYIREDYGAYDPDDPTTVLRRRAGGFAYDWHRVLIATEYERHPVGTVIQPSTELLDKYYQHVVDNFVGDFNHGETYELPLTVSENNTYNVVNIYYYQNRATVNVHYYSLDGSVNLWKASTEYPPYYPGEDFKALEVPVGFVVDEDTPMVRYTYGFSESEKNYYDFSPYGYPDYSHSDPAAGVTATLDETKELTLYYTNSTPAPMARVWLSSDEVGSEMYGYVINDSKQIVTTQIEPILLPVDADGNVDLSTVALTSFLGENVLGAQVEFTILPVADRYFYGTYWYLEGEGNWAAVTLKDPSVVEDLWSQPDPDSLFGEPIPESEIVDDYKVPYVDGKDIVIFYHWGDVG